MTVYCSVDNGIDIDHLHAKSFVKHIFEVAIISCTRNDAAVRGVSRPGLKRTSSANFLGIDG